MAAKKTEGLGSRDPFGHKPVRLERNEAEAVTQLKVACEKDVEFAAPQLKSDIDALGRAVQRNGRPEELPAWELRSEPSSLGPSPSQSVKAPGEAFERGDRIIAHEPYFYGGKPKKDPDTPGIVDGVYDNGRLVCYHRLGMPPGNVPTESIRHASGPDLKRFENTFATLDAKLQQPEKARSWER
jgi:hypothetical protein